VRARTAVRRAEQWGVEVDTVIASAVFERDNWTCHICGQEIPEHLRTVRALLGEYEPLTPVVDHKIALSKGGPHTLENCCAAHFACNARKHTALFAGTDCAEVADVVLPDVAAAPVALVQREDGGETGEQLAERGRPRINAGPCRVPGCGRPAWVKQLCRAHYHRLNRYGDPLKGVCACGCGEAISVDPSWVGLFYIDGHGINNIALSVEERLRQSVIAQPVSQRGRVYYDLTDDCLIWTGPRNPQGYGHMYLKEPGRKRTGRSLLVHRAAYELAHGEGSAFTLTIDHLCGVPLCCNPNHLDAVSHTENVKRAAAVILACPKGHPYDEINTLRNEHGHRICRQCNRNRYHLRTFGHDFVVDPDGTSTKRQRCRICREIAESQPAYCPYGHEYTPANKLLDSKGKRLCLQCQLNRRHVPAYGHEFLIDPANPSTKRRRCLTCATNAPVVTQCVKGHEYTDATSEFTAKGQRNCVICRLNKKHVPDRGHEYVIDPDSPPKKRRCLVCHNKIGVDTQMERDARSADGRSTHDLLSL
jgi:hypothetical protein